MGIGRGSVYRLQVLLLLAAVGQGWHGCVGWKMPQHFVGVTQGGGWGLVVEWRGRALLIGGVG